MARLKAPEQRRAAEQAWTKRALVRWARVPASEDEQYAAWRAAAFADLRETMPLSDIEARLAEHGLLVTARRHIEHLRGRRR